MSLLQLMMGGKSISETPKVIFLTSGSSWTVPNDWNNLIAGPGGYINKVEVIGGGGGGGNGNVNGGCGGGGGAYSRVQNLSLTIGSNIPYSVAATVGNATNGNPTWFNGTGLASASVSAAGGLKGGNDGGTPGAGGQASAGIGTTKFSGGTGGDGNDTWGGSGGGAAGPGGNGGNGAVGNPSSIPGGAGASGSWTSYPGSVTITPGDGGLAGASTKEGQPGQVYGGGGGGGDDDGDKPGGDGAQGIIVISYYPLIEANPPLESFSFVASATAQNSNSLTIPATAQSGDIAVIVDCVNTVAANIIPPTGWTQISADFVASGIGVLNAYKILSDSDPDTTLTSTNASTTDHNMICAVFRPTNITTGPRSTSITSTTIGSSNIDATTGDPGDQEIKLSDTSSSEPVIAFYSMCQRGSENVNLNIDETPTSDGSITNTVGGFNKMALYYKVYPVGITRSNTGEKDYLDDAGSQCLATWYLKFT